MELAELYRCAQIVMDHCLAVRPGEQVLIVSDTLRPQSISQALLGAALTRGAEARIALYPGRATSPQEPPRAIAKAMCAADVVLCYTTGSLTHSQARVAAQGAGARVLSMPGVNEATFLRTVRVDLSQVADLTQLIGERLAVARTAHITSATGTDLTMDMGNAPVVVDGLCLSPGELDFIPFGTTVVVPRSGSAFGRVVVDGSITNIGLVHTPVVLTVQAGRLIQVEGGREAAELRAMLAATGDPDAYNCPAEWGVGSNPGAELLGLEPTFEGERGYGWVHLALGSNQVFPGGTVAAKIHLDVILTDPIVKLDANQFLANRQFHL